MKKDVVSILKRVKAIITDSHVVYTSGRHGDGYINKDILYIHPADASTVGQMFAEKYKGIDIDVVAAPAVGGALLAQWTAYHLGLLKKKDILSVYTEKDKGTAASAAESQQIFRRGYDRVVKGEKVLVIEDLTTTGISLKKVVEAVRNAGGEVVAACVMVNRDPKLVTSESIGASFDSLGVFNLASYERNECPLCKKNVPINTQVGHGKKYVEEMLSKKV